MKHNTLLASLLLAAFAAVGAGASAQTSYIGYTTGSYVRNDGVGFSTNENKYGVAIRIPAEKAAQLKGAKIVGIRTATSTRQLNDTKIFVSRELNGTPLSETSTTAFSTALNKITLSTPVTIDGTSDLYIGYTTSLQNAEGGKPCLFDRTLDYGKGIAYGYADGEWIDLNGRGYGAPVLQLVVEGMPADYADVVVKPISVTDGYYKSGTEYAISGQVFNLGTTTINSLKMQVGIGDSHTQEIELTGLSIKPNEAYTLSVDATFQGSGNTTLTLSASEVNGTADADVSDNTSSTSAYIYPEDVQRKMLLEMFTTQGCTNCPRGHTEVKNVLSGQEDDFVEVAHHFGYYTDVFTMTESTSIGSWLYNASGTYAPAVTLNRVTPYDGLTSVIYGESPSITTGLQYAIQKIKATEPYVSVGMVNEYDEATKSGKLTVSVHTYHTPSAEVHRLNVWLTQNGIVAYQTGGSSKYVHNNVLRKSYTGTWGETLNLTEGGTETYTIEYTIPDELVSTYEDSGTYSVDTDPANMHFVAFVSDVTTSALTCTVYNANEIAVTTTGATEGINHAKVGGNAELDVQGSSLRVKGTYNMAAVYNLSGKQVATLSGAAEAQLEPGIYVVRIDGKANKVLIK